MLYMPKYIRYSILTLSICFLCKMHKFSVHKKIIYKLKMCKCLV